MDTLTNIYLLSMILTVLYAVFFYVIDSIDTEEFFAGLVVSTVPLVNTYIALAALILAISHLLVFVFDMIYIVKSRFERIHS